MNVIYVFGTYNKNTVLLLLENCVLYTFISIKTHVFICTHFFPSGNWLLSIYKPKFPFAPSQEGCESVFG